MFYWLVRLGLVYAFSNKKPCSKIYKYLNLERKGTQTAENWRVFLNIFLEFLLKKEKCMVEISLLAKFQASYQLLQEITYSKFILNYFKADY